MLGELQSLLVVFGTLERIPTVQAAVLWYTSGVLAELYIPKPYISTPLMATIVSLYSPPPSTFGPKPRAPTQRPKYPVVPQPYRSPNPHSSTQNPDTYLEGQGDSVSTKKTAPIIPIIHLLT